jgi:hypothetical protein
MANLIITIISIALVAVAALMGAYYGGAAFLEGAAKARANKVLNDFQQMEAALNLYALNNGGDYTISGLPDFTGAGDWSPLQPTYLTQNLTPAEGSGGMTKYVCGLFNSGSSSIDEITPCSTAVTLRDLSIFIGAVGEKTCLAITRMARGPSTTSIQDITSSSQIAPLVNGASGKRFDCVYYDDGSSQGIIDGGIYYLAIYRWQ